MKVAIIGAGVAGTLTAQALMKAGCEVHVFERGSAAAQGASFAHSGKISSAYTPAFFGKTFFKLCLKAFLKQTGPLHWRYLGAGARLKQYYLCLLAAWRTRASTLQNNQALLDALARYSDAARVSFLDQTVFDFESTQGVMVLYYQAHAWDAAKLVAQQNNEHIASTEDKIQPLDPAQIYALEPALAADDRLVGGLLFPNASYGNCALFTKQLRNLHQQAPQAAQSLQSLQQANATHVVQTLENVDSLENLDSLESTQAQLNSSKSGVNYKFNHHVTGLLAVQNGWSLECGMAQGIQGQQAQTSVSQQQAQVYDAVVVAAGAASAKLLSNLNIQVPTLDVHAFSVTMPASLGIDSLRRCVQTHDTQTHTQVAYVPLGNRMRVTGQYQLGATAHADSAAYKALGLAAQTRFPNAGRLSDASYEASTSSIAIDSLPIVGSTTLAGLYTNFAHGPDQWALSFGCAQALSDLITQAKHTDAAQTSRFDLTPFSATRFA